MKRYLFSYIKQDIEKKMVFLGGPRQVGKTTLSDQIGQSLDSYSYLNWDVSEDRDIILSKSWRPDATLVTFDELHKYPQWKGWIKGVFDVKEVTQEYLVTGSARLDIYKRGGDSMVGRYHYWRLHPFTLDEAPADLTPHEVYHRLLTVGGFPEPFLANDEREARRWRRERFDRILTEDIRDLKEIRNTHLLSLFVDALKKRVGGMVTVSNIAQDLQISATTAKEWLLLVERMYLAFAVYPLTKNIPRAIQKPPKVYFYDNADCQEEEGVRLENLVATHLLKRLNFLEDYHGYRCQLHYIRDKDDREVDFVTVVEGEVVDLIEVKTADKDISTSLKYYKEKLSPKNTIQIVGNLKKSFVVDGIEVVSPIEYFTNTDTAEGLW